MLSAGKNVKSTTEPLVKVQERYVYDAIRSPKPELTALLGQLRVVKRINATHYKELKTRLPYIVCAMFNPPYRNTENFAYTESFIIDIDHIADKGLLYDNLFKTVCADPRTMMCFLSPGGDGLKVMMRLKEKCYDAGLYKTFYQVFLSKFSHQYDLQQVVDSKTCDVARACFMSVDPNAYFNPDAEPVDMSQYLNPDTDILAAFDIKHQADKEAKEGDKIKANATAVNPDPSKDILQHIKMTLDPKLAQKPPKAPAYVPEILNDIMDSLKTYVEEKGIALTEVVSIQYGKKLRFKIGLKRAELNLFYGKRGFSVVQSPKTGTDAEANAIMAEVIQAFIAEYT